MARRSSVAVLFLLPLLGACHDGGDAALEARVAALEAQLAALQFSQIQGTVADAQVPDDITIDFAATAGDADTLDGYHANEIAESGSFTPTAVFAPGFLPLQPFSYLRTGSRVRVTGVLTLLGPGLLPANGVVGDLPYRLIPFAAPTDLVGTATGALTWIGNPEPTSCAVVASVGLPGASLSILTLGGPIVDGGTISLDFSYDVDP